MPIWRGVAIFAIILAATSGISVGQPRVPEKAIYNETVDARTEIKEALEKARTEHKRVIVVFGANWCYDCHVLDAAFHRPEQAAIIAASYEVVHVDVGKFDKNLDLMKKYEVPRNRGMVEA